MGLFDWLGNQIRVKRAGQIAKDKTERKQLANAYQTEDTQKRIKKLDQRIAENEERNKIASENNLKPKSTTKNYSVNNETTVNNGINTTFDLSKKQKSKK